ncbi:MAG: sulfotransferase family protein [Panacagrimonas sp.]
MTESATNAAPPRTVEALLAAATAETGLEDFGDRHFMTGLSAFVHALPGEAALNAVGDQMVYGGIHRLLCNRLRYARDVKLHPKILDEKIVKPIVILGLPRTGTSKLQRVMSADPEVQRLDFWRTINPAPFPGEEPGNPSGRIAAALVVEQTLATMFPGWMARHPMEALEPDEELHIMDGSFECVIAWLFSRTPSYYAYISKCDPKPMYRHLHQQLQYLQWQDGGARGRPWIMKSPVHIGALPTLLETFPDAILVHCHRDLQKVIPSFASLIEEGRKIGSDNVDPVEVGRDMCEYWATSLDRYMADREKLPAGRILDIAFTDICADVVAVIRRIYAAAGRPVTAAAVAAFEDYDARRPEHHFGKYEYSAAHYGYTAEMIDRRFAAYRKRFIDSGRMAFKETARG